MLHLFSQNCAEIFSANSQNFLGSQFPGSDNFFSSEFTLTALQEQFKFKFNLQALKQQSWNLHQNQSVRCKRSWRQNLAETIEMDFSCAYHFVPQSVPQIHVSSEEFQLHLDGTNQYRSFGHQLLESDRVHVDCHL